MSFFMSPVTNVSSDNIFLGQNCAQTLITNSEKTNKQTNWDAVKSVNLFLGAVKLQDVLTIYFLWFLNYESPCRKGSKLQDVTETQRELGKGNRGWKEDLYKLPKEKLRVELKLGKNEVGQEWDYWWRRIEGWERKWRRIGWL